MGWYELENQGAKYRIGSDPFYHKYSLPARREDRTNVFYEGTGFLDIGHYNFQISMVFLAAHLAFSLYWLEKKGLNFRSVFFLRGSTNLFKTAVVTEVANVFCTDKQVAVNRLSSTKASAQDMLTKLWDSLVVFDDYSNTESNETHQSSTIAEFLLRAVGDGVFPSKMNASDFSEQKTERLRSVLMFTGEEPFRFGNSSNLRMIVVPIERGTSDPEQLSVFQQHRNIMREYLYLYICFLAECGDKVVQGTSKFAAYRKEYQGMLNVPRLADSAAVLRLQVDLIEQFAWYCKVPSEDVNHLTTMLIKGIKEGMLFNQQENNLEAPHILFLKAVTEFIDNTHQTKIAKDENEFAEHQANYLGFWEGEDKLWLYPEKAYKEVRAHYRALGSEFYSSLNSIKKKLFEAGFSQGKKASGTGGNEYLVRAKKGMRPRMLVLHMNKVRKIWD